MQPRSWSRLLNLVFSVLPLFACTWALHAQTPCLQRKSPPLTEASPQSVGMSPDRLARIDALADKAVRDGVVPGLVALVARHGRIVYYKAFGQADAKAGRPQKR